MSTETMPMVRDTAPMSAARMDTLQWRAAIESMNEVTKFVAEGLREGIDNDYAVIPGTGTKKTLLKPGAQKICMAFNVYPRPQVTRRNLDNDHVEYEVMVELVSRGSGEVVSTGVGICSSKETKYRYKGDAVESTGEAVPKAYWDAKKSGDAGRMAALLGGKGFRAKKIDDTWMICKSSGEKQENPDIADTYNTVLKMAEKRGLMDATLNLSCISQHFTQDLDERLPNATAGAPEPPIQEAEIVTPEQARTEHYLAAYNAACEALGLLGDDSDTVTARKSVKRDWTGICKRHGAPQDPVKQTDEQNAECVREFREAMNTKALQDANAELTGAAS